MAYDILEKYLDYFRKKTGPLKGETVQARADILIRRWENVINECDSSQDKTKYRQNYADIHALILYNIKIVEGQSEEFAISILNRELDNLRSSFLHFGINTDDGGAIDGAGYIIAELEQALNV